MEDRVLSIEEATLLPDWQTLEEGWKCALRILRLVVGRFRRLGRVLLEPFAFRDKREVGHR